ncbi:unnamed protein product [Rotaria sordida]|uniref:Uncharacterized protein n=1 Tax=Rotaria sordida TaxID=392033 RepID=A0A813RY12_9BILA|nr:unnamed protein product [Rotaria sordida]CAF3561031.1 unnamed protein product [Rotaria sordida]
MDIKNNPLQVDMNMFMKSNGELKNLRHFMSLVERHVQYIRDEMQKELSNRTIIVSQSAQQNAQGLGYLANAQQFVACQQSPQFYERCPTCQGATYIVCPNCPQDSGQYVPCPQC